MCLFNQTPRKGEVILNEMQALTVGNLHCSTLARCLPDHFYHSEPNCVNTSVQGADTGTSRDAVTVQGPAPVTKFEEGPTDLPKMIG